MAERSPTKPDKERVVVAGRPDYLLSSAFVVLWVLPILWVGITHQKRVPLVGDFLNHNYGIACLFPDRSTGWNDYHFQVRLENRTKWFETPESDYTRMEPFGHRTRLHRMLGLSARQPHGMLQRQHMAEFIKTRYEYLHPESPKIAAMRFVYVHYKASDDAAKQKGRWVTPPLSAAKRFYVRSTHYFDGRLPENSRGQRVRLRTKRR